MYKAYSVEQLRNMLFVDYQIIKHQLDNKIDSLTTEEEKEILRQANEIRNVPYEYRRNKFNFEVGKEKDAEKEDKRQENILIKADEMRKKIKEHLSENELITALNIIKLEKINK